MSEDIPEIVTHKHHLVTSRSGELAWCCSAVGKKQRMGPFTHIPSATGPALIDKTYKRQKAKRAAFAKLSAQERQEAMKKYPSPPFYYSSPALVGVTPKRIAGVGRPGLISPPTATGEDSLSMKGPSAKSAGLTPETTPPSATPPTTPNYPPIFKLRQRLGFTGAIRNVRGPFGKFNGFLATVEVGSKIETWSVREFDGPNKALPQIGHTYRVITGYVQDGEFKGAQYFRLREVSD